MGKIKKVLFITIFWIFLYQSLVFCTPAKDFSLRPSLHFSRNEEPALSLEIVEDIKGEKNVRLILNTTYTNLLSGEMLNKIKENVSWITMKPDKFSGARSIILILDNPIQIGNKTFKAIQIKGVVFWDGRTASPPTNEVFDPNIHKLDGATIIQSKGYMDFLLPEMVTMRPSPKQPKAGMRASEARDEYKLTNMAFKDGQNTCIAFGYGEFLDLPFEDDKVGFLILGIEDPEEVRLKDLIEEARMKLGAFLTANIRPGVKPLTIRSAALDYVNYVGSLLYREGRELRRFHDAGYAHTHPHPGQFSQHKNHINIHDLTAAKHMTKETPLYEIIGRRFNDVRAALTGANEVMRGGDSYEALQQFFSFVGKTPFENFIRGYFYDRKISDQEMQQFFSQLNEFLSRFYYPPRDISVEENRQIPFSSTNNYAVGLIRNMSSAWLDSQRAILLPRPVNKECL